MVCANIGVVPSVTRDLQSLILVDETHGALRWVDKVGTGFDDRLRQRLNGVLWSRLRDRPIVASKIKGQWAEPWLYCKVGSMERTTRDELRAPMFEELSDKTDG
jgi:hypothetical protein